MIKQQIKMERSPYHIERDEKTTKENRKGLHADVSPEVYEDFMQYVENAKTNKNQALSDLVINFLNNNVFEQKFFRNMNAILLLPKNLKPDEVNEKAKVIGFIDGGEYITLNNVFYGGGLEYPLTYNFMYTLREFNEEHYNWFLHYFNVIYNYDFNIFFNVDKETQQDFDKVKARLSELYEDIDIDDAYFIMFTFNNYLDIFQDGVYRSKTSALEHEGVNVFFEDLLNGVFARVKWSYIENELSFSLQFEDIKEFESSIAFNISNIGLLEDFRKTTQIVSNPEGKLLFNKKHLEQEIAYLKQELEKKEQKLNETLEDLSQYYDEIDG